MIPRPFFLFSATLALLGASACSRSPGARDEAPAAIVKGERIVFPKDAPQLASLAVQPAAARTLALTHLTGRLFWNVRIYAPVAGRVVSIAAALGDRLAADAPLARLASPDFGQAQADARKAGADLLLARRTLARTKDLFEHGAMARKDLEAAEDAFAAAEAEQQRAGARLTLYGAADGEVDGLFTLRSPLAGVLVEKNINPGQEVRADQSLANAPQILAPLFVVSDPTKLWLQLDAAETDLAALRVGQALRIQTRAFPDQVFSGTIENIGLTLDPQSRSIKVRGVVGNPDGLLKAEMYVFVDVVQDESQNAQAGVEVRAKAVFMVDNQAYVFVELAPGQYERRAVQVGTEKDGRIPVLAGVSAGQKVVVEGALLLESVLVPN
jgi:cobalt-zinc-cadmium efflux system membrane fusion protein